ncbi:MAG: hydrogenase [Polyangiaceae bacterium]|nr:hydrogenase [Polyangiaceae bacterium]
MRWLIPCAIALTALSGVAGLLPARRARLGELLAVGLVVLGAALGLAGSVVGFVASDALRIDLPWSLPGARLLVRVDALSSMFLAPLFFVSAAGAVYGLSYWPVREHPRDARGVRLYYGLTVAGLATVLCAANAVLFLVGWEVMALGAFMLVGTEHERAEVRGASLVYLVSTRAGTLCLFGFFGLLYAITGSLDFDLGAVAGRASATELHGLFVLALCGFGLKAGLMPLHVWLPGAHANAPSHVSALMSGVLLKMGVYGLVRTTAFFPTPPLWWGAALVGCGVVSGILGVAFALGQHDLKRLLAYHSVENIGIIALGLGLALVGRSLGAPALVGLGLAGALLHVWNHGLFKALLFLAAGAVVHATGTREIDALGGLGKRMPKTALAFLVGSVAICGLPPLNGFVSELLVYLGLFEAAASPDAPAWLVGALGAPALALIGALAVACFVKVYGVVFLGEPRSAKVDKAHEVDKLMTGPMAALGAACALIGLAPALVMPALARAAHTWAPELADEVGPVASLAWLSLANGLLLGLVLVAAAWLAWRARAAATVRDVPTWDCGYAAPTPRMQYTASSFAATLVGFFAFALRPSRFRPELVGPFPQRGTLFTSLPDVVLGRLILPAFALIGPLLARLRKLTQGSVHTYLLYMLVAVVAALLVWR